MMTKRTFIGFALTLWALGCGGETHEHTGTGGMGGMGGSTGAGTSVCADDPRAMTYTAGLEQKGEQNTVSVKLLESTPAPPAKGTNIWKIQLLDAQGMPLDGATITATPMMPDHGHGSSTTPVVTPAGMNGEYTIDPIDLAMAGIWVITLDITPTGGTADKVVFSFCIEG